MTNYELRFNNSTLNTKHSATMENDFEELKNGCKHGFLFLLVCMAIGFLVLLFGGCQTVKYVPTETIKTEIVQRTDTINVTRHDSVFIHEKGDTVFVERFQYIDRWRTKINIEQRTDSIPYAVEVVREVNKLTTWQRWQIGGFWVIVVLVILFVALRIVRFIYLRK